MTLSVSAPSDKTVSYFAVTSIVITLFLFFIDEGYYSFSWMTNPGAWFVFLIYTVALTFIQTILYLILQLVVSNELTITRFIIGGLITLSLLLAVALVLF